MSTRVLSPKSGGYWSEYDLINLDIKVVIEDPETFFGVTDLPEPTVSPVIWNNAEEPQDVPISKLKMDFFGYLKSASRMSPDSESTVKDLVAFLLKMLEFDAGRHLVYTYKEMSFSMCSETVTAQSDVVLADRSSGAIQNVLLVQENKVSENQLYSLP